MFQSTPPRGGRLAGHARALDGIRRVSIHAPARGATGIERHHAPSCSDRLFQSTPPRGGRRDLASSRRSALTGFNPRPRAGGDSPLTSHARYRRVSIHAPARGATLQRSGQRAGRAVSIHAPARGATRGRRHDVIDRYGVSIHAPAQGATCVGAQHGAHDAVSIHAPARGATDRMVLLTSSHSAVSIHAPARGATWSGIPLSSR